MVVSAVFALQHAQEDVGHEHFHLVLQMVLEVLHQNHEYLQRQTRNLRNVGSAVAQQRYAQVGAHCVNEFLLSAERRSRVVQDVQD